LRATHASIPAALASEQRLKIELGTAEVGGGDVTAEKARLAAVSSGRESDVRRRCASAQELSALEPDLTAARQSVETARERFAADVVAEFRQRYAAQLAVLQQLQTEGRALSQALRVPVPLSAVPAAPPAVPLLESFREALRPPTGVERIGSTLDRLDSAGAICGGIRASRALDSRFIRMQELDNGATGNVTGVFRVMKPTRCQFDGLEFAPGTLVDASLFGGPGSLRRAVTARFVRLVSDATAADVAAA
jgi:hypothetical protein